MLRQQLHLAGLDLGEVEDVVDDREQVLAGPVDLLQVGRRVLLDVLGGQLLEQLAVADDGIQGRAQLVAHVGQERALDLAGFHGLLVGHDEVGVDAAQLLLDPLALADLPLQHVVGPGQLGRAARARDVPARRGSCGGSLRPACAVISKAMPWR